MILGARGVVLSIRQFSVALVFVTAKVMATPVTECCTLKKGVISYIMFQYFFAGLVLTVVACSDHERPPMLNVDVGANYSHQVSTSGRGSSLKAIEPVNTNEFDGGDPGGYKIPVCPPVDAGKR